MSAVREILETYPRSFNVEAAPLARGIEALIECANLCSQCADACLSEPGLSPELAKCIRLNLDCADVCAATSRVVSRQTEYDANVTRSMLEACATICRSCGDECESHAAMAHCQVCSAACRQCEEACRQLLAAMG